MPSLSCPPTPRLPAPPTPALLPETPLTARGHGKGVGLTPRLSQRLLGDREATFSARPARFVESIDRHVQSVEPSPLVMALNFVPMLLEEEDGGRRVLHVDPLAVRKYRYAVAEELRAARAQRKTLLRRLKDLRKRLPKPRAMDVAQALEREALAAEARIGEALLSQLPPDTRSVQLLVEVNPCVLQLKLLAETLLKELTPALVAVGCQRIGLATLGRAPKGAPPALIGATLREADTWLRQLAELPQPPAAPGAGGYRLAPLLRSAVVADCHPEGRHLLLLVASSAPSDAEACRLALERSKLAFQVSAVFGSCAEDPEPWLQHLADFGGEGSRLRLFFGDDYWRGFAALRRKRLAGLRRKAAACEEDHYEAPEALEVRLLERAMREVYAEEQRCEEELRCAGRLLDRSLVDSEDLRAALQAAPKTGAA